ncbi:HlyD family efflux transporter periplasmic adaptor subunit [candidate division NPL-UPA2 bacterium]|nr:HlyD family efflux transporter periplasmic adaptor subunit [candidate division NPL-UPA2 bacterium]
MDKKKRNIRKSSTKKILRLLPLFAVATGLFIGLVVLLLWVGKIDKTVPASGIFEAYPQAEIKATVKDTVVDSILVEVGEEVEKGEVLIRLKDQAQVYERRAQLKERLKLAEIDLKRMKRLSDKGYVATRDRQEAELKVKILAREVSAFQRKINALTIVAPFAGTVVGIPVEVGDAVYMGQRLMFLARSEERALRMWIKEEDSGEVKIGQKVRIYSRVFCHRRHGIASGNIVAIKGYPKIRDGENYVEAVARIMESPFPVKVGSRAEAKIIIRRCSILKLLVGLE